ncbi:hypothetical protein OsI_23107 [Oryza sativa Indica Group]|uniref:Uncharacterized protein n=1 Tax=Oryza sativa subsp. indica TaxID=39946 RepID=B8B2V3_ORYSI|nr:hypothetical protein OsI_23107 [Oryza sativa Indica Group]
MIFRLEGEGPQLYSPDDGKFTAEVHHGGFFVGQGSNRAYVDQTINWIDHCEARTWDIVCLDELLAMLGYDMTPDFKAYWLLPGKTLEDGLRVISTRADFEVMKSVVHKVKNFIIYFDQGDTIAGVDWDDVVANPISELPRVLSPRKMPTADRKVPNKQDDSDSDGSLEDDTDFVDSDYDISDADDDLYVDNVDMGVEDLSDCKAKSWKKAKGSQLKRKEIVVRNSDGEEVSTDDEDLQLPDSDDDGEILTAVGIDPNDCIYPIAIAVVETESLRSWRWFLQTLKEDLGIDNTYPWTIMTDKQKVLTQSQSAYDQLLSQVPNPMVAQMFEESSQVSQMETTHGPLPDNQYILSNQPAVVSTPMTTATKEGKSRANKRKCTTEGVSGVAATTSKNRAPRKKATATNK